MLVIGAGRIGTALFKRAQEHHVTCALLDRNSGWEQLQGEPGCPILVATRNDALPSIIEQVPPSHHSDLVFIQNGMIRPWLKQVGLEENTRGLLFFAVPTKGAPITPGEASPFCGKHASEVVKTFVGMEIPAQEVTGSEFASLELEKLLWIAAHGLMGETYQQSVGDIMAHREEELRELVYEYASLGIRALDLTISKENLYERVKAYSLSIPQWQARVKEWPWRNQWFEDLAHAKGQALLNHERLVKKGL